MFFYLIHNLPWGLELENGKRNVRTFLIGSVCYILFHALLYANNKNFIGMPMLSSFLYMIQRYFWWVLIADSIAMSITYKLAYGRSILTELPLLEVIGGWFKGNRPELQPQLIVPAINPPAITILPKSINPMPISMELDIKNKKLPVANMKDLVKNLPKNNDDLDIDLLTENESIKPIINNNLIPQPIVSDENIDEKDDINENKMEKEIKIESIIETKVENKSNTNMDVSDVSSLHSSNVSNNSSGSSGPKLTTENIKKYVLNRDSLKIKHSELDIKSEDLHL